MCIIAIENVKRIAMTEKNMNNNNDRNGRAKDVKGAFFPTPVAPSDMPDWYGDWLAALHGFSPRNLNTCDDLLRSGQMRQLCNGALHNYRGDTTSV